MASEKAGRQGLIVLINIIFEIIFNMARHDDNGLSYQEKEYSLQKGHRQYQQAIEQNAERENIVHAALQCRSTVQIINVEGFNDKVQSIADELRRYDTKKIGYDCKDGSQDQVPLIFPQVLIEVL